MLCFTSWSGFCNGFVSFVSFTSHANHGWPPCLQTYADIWLPATIYLCGLLCPNILMMTCISTKSLPVQPFLWVATTSDLLKVRAAGRIWMLMTNPASTRRSLSTASKTLSRSLGGMAFAIPDVYFVVTPLRLEVDALADARADGDLVGIGGFTNFLSGACVWCSQKWTLDELSCLGLPLCRPAHKDIACYETLAHLALVHCYRAVFPSGKVAVRLPSFSDSAATEAVGANLFTFRWPRGAFARSFRYFPLLRRLSSMFRM